MGSCNVLINSFLIWAWCNTRLNMALFTNDDRIWIPAIPNRLCFPDLILFLSNPNHMQLTVVPHSNILQKPRQNDVRVDLALPRRIFCIWNSYSCSYCCNLVTCLESISSSVGQNTVLPISIDRRLEIYKKENRQTTLVVIVQWPSVVLIFQTDLQKVWAIRGR